MATEKHKNDIIDGMVRGSQSDPGSLTHWHHKLGGTIGDTVTLNIYFLTDPANALSYAAQNAVWVACRYWENISGITFTEVFDTKDAHITFSFEDFGAAGINPDWYGASHLAPNLTDVTTSGYKYAEVLLNTMRGGVAHFENALNEPRYFRVLLHEIGHALGLEHPDANGDNDTAPEADNSLYSIMAKGYPEGIPLEGRLPNETPMAYDILAIQKLYDKNMSYKAGDDTYQWDTNNRYLAIWDAGGTDTIDLSNQTGMAFVDLSEGDNGGGEIKITDSNGQVRFYAGIAFDTLIENATGTNQDDSITGNDQANILKGYGGNDYLEGGLGQDTLDGGADDDTFYVQGTDTAYDKFIGGAGTDKILGSSGNDVIRVHELLASDSIEVIDGGGGVNRIEGTDQADTIDLSASTVSKISGVYGGIGNDTLIGTSGQDYLYGGADNDVLDGRGGNDVLEGGAGHDTYKISSGSHVTIRDDGNNVLVVDGQVFAGAFVRESGTNTYRFTSGSGNYTMRFNSPGVLTINETTSITFANQTSAADFADGAFGIRLVEQPETVRTLTGSGIDDRTFSMYYDDVYYLLFTGTVSGTSMVFTGSDQQKYHGFPYDLNAPPSLQVLGYGGNDVLYGFKGEDELRGGDGHDVLLGDLEHLILPDGNVVPLPGTGSRDLLYGENGSDLLLGREGNDVLFGGGDNDFLSGEQGNDMLDGGAGQDLLAGGDGDDRLTGGSGDDVLLGDEYIFYGDSSFAWLSAQPATWSMGLSYDEAGRISKLNTHGFSLSNGSFSGNDLLNGGDGQDYLVGGGGNDTLYGGTGHDRLEGGDGNDMLDGGDGNDLFYGEAGHDLMHGGKGDDQLSGGEGNDTLWGDAGNDILLGGAGADVLVGGGGRDYLDGGEGNDLYRFGYGSGIDIIADLGQSGGDVVQFSGDITVDKVLLSRFKDDLYLGLHGSDDVLVLAGWFSGGNQKVERLLFADGTVWDAAAVEVMLCASPVEEEDPDNDILPPMTSDASGGGIWHGDTFVRLPLEYFIYLDSSGQPLQYTVLDAFTGFVLASNRVPVPQGPENLLLEGTVYNDSLYGGAGDDSLLGKEGNDFRLVRRICG